MSETLSDLENLHPGSGPEDVGKTAVAAAIQAETDAIFAQIAEAMEADEQQGELARKIGVVATVIKQDFQHTLFEKGEREVLEGQVRERSTRRIFRVFRELPGDEQVLTAFQQHYRQAEEEADHMDKQALSDLVDEYADTPVFQALMAVRRSAGYEASSTKMLRTSILLMDRYGY